MPFNNPVAAGGGALIRSSIHSPNYPGPMSWSVNQDGSASFFGVTLTGGSLIVETSGQGVFVYSGTPALGNLIVSIASAAGVDAYGNAYIEGVQGQNGGVVSVTTSDGRFMTLTSTATGAALLLQPPNEVGHTWTRGIIATDYDAPTERPIMQIHSPFDAASGNTQPRAIIDMRGDNNTLGGTRIDMIVDDLIISSQNAAIGTVLQLDGTLYGTNPVSGAAELYHAVGTQGSTWGTGWGPSSPYNPGFRLKADGDVQLQGAAFNSAAAVGQTMFTLTAAYSPSVPRTLPCYGRTNTVLCFITINTNGTVVLTSMSGSATNHTVEFELTYSL
ncbi:MAG: hypothetical protein ACRDNK_04285 [Solirubrobacteraceae bacterium]